MNPIDSFIQHSILFVSHEFVHLLWNLVDYIPKILLFHLYKKEFFLFAQVLYLSLKLEP